MNRKEFIKYISNELSFGRNVDFEYQINGITYNVKFFASDMVKGINIQSIVAIPLAKILIIN